MYGPRIRKRVEASGINGVAGGLVTQGVHTGLDSFNEEGETMTWKEFKEKLEAEGVSDADAILYIDVTDYGEPYALCIQSRKHYDHNAWTIENR